MDNNRAPHGWVHSCGSFFYQLECPQPCKDCAKEGSWVWVEKNENGFYISYLKMEGGEVQTLEGQVWAWPREDKDNVRS